MRSRDLTEKQAAELAERLCPIVAHLHKLETRMAKLGFPTNDPLYKSARQAYEAAHDLRMQAHYLGCREQTG